MAFNAAHHRTSRRSGPGARTVPLAAGGARHRAQPWIAGCDPHLFSTGTNLVVALDDELVLKIFPPMLRDQFISERSSLSQLRGRLGVPIPEIVFEGERDQWPYLVITRLSGDARQREAWPTLPEDQKERVLGQIGATIAEVQRVPVGELVLHRAALGPFHLRANRGCRAAAPASRACRKNILDGLDEILARGGHAHSDWTRPPVMLTGEYIPENFLLSRENGNWRLAGLIDFGDVMTGWGEYDLLGPSAFMTAGMPRRVREPV